MARRWSGGRRKPRGASRRPALFFFFCHIKAHPPAGAPPGQPTRPLASRGFSAADPGQMWGPAGSEGVRYGAFDVRYRQSNPDMNRPKKKKVSGRRRQHGDASALASALWRAGAHRRGRAQARAAFTWARHIRRPRRRGRRSGRIWSGRERRVRGGGGAQGGAAGQRRWGPPRGCRQRRCAHTRRRTRRWAASSARRRKRAGRESMAAQVAGG